MSKPESDNGAVLAGYTREILYAGSQRGPGDNLHLSVKPSTSLLYAFEAFDHDLQELRIVQPEADAIVTDIPNKRAIK